MSSDKPQLGYQDTPIIPGTRWHVHDGERPQPRVVTPGTFSSQDKAGTPPSDAVVLFDGKNLDQWESVLGGAAPWKVENGYFEVAPKSKNIRTKAEFGDCQLHLEFNEPTVITGDGQKRGNSGIFMMGLYEIQVLDCFNNPTYPDGTTGAIYGQYPPLVNAVRKPGEWQEYDIIWIAPKFNGEALLAPACVTVLLNGIVVQHAITPLGPTKHKTTPQYRPHAPTGPVVLQDHNDLVRFRNIWIRPLGTYDQA